MAEDIAATIEAAGFLVLGHLQAAHAAIPGAPDDARTLLLIDWGGGGQWPLFQAAPEHADGQPHPLDRWTRRIVDALAEDLVARALYPSDGPPWFPFQSWALAAGIAHRSPIGLLIHARYGLWHSYRAALAFDRALDLAPLEVSFSPCETCVGRPCLAACPIGAYAPDRFDVTACRTHVASPDGEPCRDGGCFSRNACPVGGDWRNSPDQIRFHQRAFLRSSLGSD